MLNNQIPFIASGSGPKSSVPSIFVRTSIPSGTASGSAILPDVVSQPDSVIAQFSILLSPHSATTNARLIRKCPLPAKRTAFRFSWPGSGIP
ncbi:hypothetical protein Mboo_1249 [Methanoregula boonei 6A8]|uniref:Uncharacterized protein n=1 Tax=Methanoregula boonei (strain DSM 21154 / JCM 14090 / 6A8) TaxID=456442 RepID=A7I7Q6_METB6|nr:hypothetical protein Mboo_1249 [Methanoregula boonei 6A8]